MNSPSEINEEDLRIQASKAYKILKECIDLNQISSPAYMMASWDIAWQFMRILRIPPEQARKQFEETLLKYTRYFSGDETWQKF